MSGSKEGLSQSLKEAIVGAIVKAGIEDADGVIKILEDLRKMKKKMRPKPMGCPVSEVCVFKHGGNWTGIQGTGSVSRESVSC